MVRRGRRFDSGMSLSSHGWYINHCQMAYQDKSFPNQYLARVTQHKFRCALGPALQSLVDYKGKKRRLLQVILKTSRSSSDHGDFMLVAQIYTDGYSA